ncbi:hypothetical protein [Caenimonas koreensis]|uniref:hypothetical protein n=1 Tax=Caenimonas koreensis TaxID=367474 RepID=UPI00378301F1
MRKPRDRAIDMAHRFLPGQRIAFHVFAAQLQIGQQLLWLRVLEQSSGARSVEVKDDISKGVVVQAWQALVAAPG